jgi:hypothetical protein
MFLAPPDSWGRTPHRRGRSLSWWDAESQCTLVVAEPAAEPALWKQFVSGVQRIYRKYGVEQAIDLDALNRQNDTALFCVGVNDQGTVAGGLRVKGPLTRVEECHAVTEWHGQPGLGTVRARIADRLPAGVLEIKSAWVTDDPGQSGSLTEALGRLGLHCMDLLGARFIVATTAGHALDRWLTTGGVLAADVPAAPYPDARYETRMVWWDQRTFGNLADSKLMDTFRAEAQRLTRRRIAMDAADELAAAAKDFV